MQTQGTTVKKPCTKEFRLKETKSTDGKTPVSFYSNESAKPNCKKKRLEWLKKKKNSTLATRDNTIEDKKKRTPGNTSQMTSYNC